MAATQVYINVNLRQSSPRHSTFLISSVYASLISSIRCIPWHPRHQDIQPEAQPHCYYQSDSDKQVENNGTAPSPFYLRNTRVSDFDYLFLYSERLLCTPYPSAVNVLHQQRCIEFHKEYLV